VSYTHSSGSQSVYSVATLSALYPVFWIAQNVQSRYTECPIPTFLDRPTRTQWLHWGPNTHSAGSPNLYRVAALSALYLLRWMAQPVPSRYTECPIPTPLDRPTCSESLHWVPYSHYLWIDQPVRSRYTKCPIPTLLDRTTITESLNWVPYTQSTGSPTMYWVATQIALHSLLWIAQTLPFATLSAIYPNSGSPNLYRVPKLSALYPFFWIAQPLPSRYTECPTLTPLDRTDGTASLNWVPCYKPSGSPSLYPVAKLSAVYPNFWIAQLLASP